MSDTLILYQVSDCNWKEMQTTTARFLNFIMQQIAQFTCSDDLLEMTLLLRGRSSGEPEGEKYFTEGDVTKCWVHVESATVCLSRSGSGATSG